MAAQLNEPTNQNLMKVPKVIYPTNDKTLLYKTLETNVLEAQCLLPPCIKPLLFLFYF